MEQKKHVSKIFSYATDVLAGYLIGDVIGNFVPGGEWIGGLIGAAAGALVVLIRILIVHKK